MEWRAFNERYPRAHLVIGSYDPWENVWRPGRFAVLARLVVSLGPRGAWALQTVRRPPKAAIYVAYEMGEDAVKLQSAVRALPTTGRHLQRWITQTGFQFDRPEVHRLSGLISKQDGV